MHFRKYTALFLLFLLLASAAGCRYLKSPTVFTPPEEVEASSKDPKIINPYESFERFRVEGDAFLLPFEKLTLRSESEDLSLSSDTLDFLQLKEGRDEDFLTLCNVPYASLSVLSGALQYDYEGIPEGSFLLKKELGEGTSYVVLKKNAREAMLHYKEGNHHFETVFSLHGETYLKNGILYLPVADLLEITGHVIHAEDTPLSFSYEKSQDPYPALSFMETTEKRKAEGYYEALLRKEKEQDLSFILLGDTAVATTLGRKNGFDKLWLEHGGGYFLAGLQKEFQKADMVIANLENVFTQETRGQKDKLYNMKAPRIEYIDVLPLGGITHVNIVNNHMVDFLEAGFEESLTHLEANGIEYLGTNETFTENIEIGNVFVESSSVFEKDGIKVGLLGYLGFNTSSVSDERIMKDIERMRRVEKVDYIVTSIHWGGQNTHEVTWKQKEMGRKLIDMGSDLVYGHHPHVLQEVEVYQGKPIYYSFGNFLFLDYKGVKDPDSVLVHVTLRKDRFGELHSEFTHKPIYWAGHTSRNLYTPILMDNESHIRRALEKLKLDTTAPIDFSKRSPDQD